MLSNLIVKFTSTNFTQFTIFISTYIQLNLVKLKFKTETPVASVATAIARVVSCCRRQDALVACEDGATLMMEVRINGSLVGT